MQSRCARGLLKGVVETEERRPHIPKHLVSQMMVVTGVEE